MTFLVLAVITSTINHLLFKVFSRFRIDLLTVITTNYAVCVIIGYSSSIESVSQYATFSYNWYPFSILQGIILVTCLFLLGRTTEKHGVATATIATRLSVAMPTLASFFLYGDMVTGGKTAGIFASLLALYMSGREKTETPESQQSFKVLSMLPFILFLAFGVHSTLIKFVQERFLGAESYHVYMMSAFFSAFLISGSVLGWRILKRQQALRWKDLASGLALGGSNYGAIYFLIRALSVPGGQSSRIFPTISIAVVILSSFGAWVFFDERPGWRMAGALVIGAGSIILVNLS